MMKKRAFLLLLLALTGATGAWGQSTGLYYIANNNDKTPYYNSSTPSTNYYLVPASNGGNTSVNINTWAWNDYAATPFVTTYKTNQDNNSAWVIKASETSGEYYLIHVLTGKYMTRNDGVGASGKPQNRRAFHMENTSNLGNDHLFVFTASGTYYNIRAKSLQSGHCYVNPSKSNQDQYYGTTQEGGYAVGGLIGLYNSATDPGSKWYLEPAALLPSPTINFSYNQGDDNFTVTITHNSWTQSNPLPADYTILYTTNGDDPAIGGSTTHTYTSAVTVNACTMKAVVAGHGLILTEVATETVSAAPEISFNNATNLVSISCVDPNVTIYYTYGNYSNLADPTTTTGANYTVTGPFTPFSEPGPTTVKAIASKNGNVSAVTTKAIDQVAMPTIQNNGNNAISITSATTGATIYYTTDGSTPTTSSNEYTGPLTENASGRTIKAIAVKEDMVTSAEGNGMVTLQCATPLITRYGMTFSISCDMPTDATFYYSLDGSTPTTLYSGPVSFTSTNPPMTVKAIATHANFTDSGLATFVLTNGNGTASDPYLIYSDADFASFVSDVNTGTATASTYYKLAVDVSASGVDPITTAFSGTFDGGMHTISNLGHPLFTTITGGIVKNVMLKAVQINESGNVGAIAGEASGYTRIYNCGILPTNAANSSPSTVASTGGYCGGLVGWLKDDSRVINCFSYANITGGTDVAGIVGHNEVASTTEVTDGKYANLKTAVVNCMFYGNITGGTNRYPVYGGAKIVNNTTTGINNYDFYRAEASVGTLTDYNCSWPAKEEYLTHYEYYRYLLNSNRELCGWWVGAASAPSTMTTTDVQAVPKDASLMAKWVLDPAVAPYPILKPFGKYASPINIDADASWRTTANEWEGKKLGTLKVTINPGSHASGDVSTLSDVDFVITDMDTLRGDYCYRKIQLPYYNTVFGNPNGSTLATKFAGNYGAYVVTGWDVSTTEGTVGTFSTDPETGYNFADRNCTAKDANRVFAQGGYYYVPNGVTSITITAHWANAIYLDNTDHYYDRVSVSTFTNSNNVFIGSSDVLPFEPAGTRSNSVNGNTVNNGTISSNVPSGSSVYENAIVLVGNHQEFAGNSIIGNSSKACTIMSADFDFDDEPDYCLIWQLGKNVDRNSFCPIRFDFLPVVEMGLAMKEDGSTQYYSLGCFRPLGHFEVTETSLIHFVQFEFSNKDRAATALAPIILNGGSFYQYTKGTRNYAKSNATDPINYIIIGGNVRIPSFTPGAHASTNANFPTRHCPVNIIGGNIDNVYLTGNYNNEVTPNQDNPHCYIDGGRFKQVAAAGKEGINGNVYFKINHSKIWEFYGGSTMDQISGNNFKIVKGDIHVTIDNSVVNKYCGGPKFGDMIDGKTITTDATNTTFGVYYGGGNGGTSYVQYDNTDGEQTVSDNFDWENKGKLKNYTAGSYRDLETGYMADYDMEIVSLSTGTNQNRAVYRTYFYAAQFSATNTGSITNNLTNCTVLTNFYGGGNLGGVNGNVTSTLDGTTRVLGSAYGAGYSASVPNVTIHNKDKVAPTINVYTGIITPESSGTSTTYTWTHANTLSTSNPISADGNYFFTEKSLDNLGSITGNVTLKLKGNTTVTGSVFGGGEQSAVIKDENVTDSGNTTVIISERAKVFGNIYGGGNMGEVSGDTKVIINGAVNTNTNNGNNGGE